MTQPKKHFCYNARDECTSSGLFQSNVLRNISSTKDSFDSPLTPSLHRRRKTNSPSVSDQDFSWYTSKLVETNPFYSEKTTFQQQAENHFHRKHCKNIIFAKNDCRLKTFGRENLWKNKKKKEKNIKQSNSRACSIINKQCEQNSHDDDFIFKPVAKRITETKLTKEKEHLKSFKSINQLFPNAKINQKSEFKTNSTQSINDFESNTSILVEARSNVSCNTNNFHSKSVRSKSAEILHVPGDIGTMIKKHTARKPHHLSLNTLRVKTNLPLSCTLPASLKYNSSLSKRKSRRLKIKKYDSVRRLLTSSSQVAKK